MMTHTQRLEKMLCGQATDRPLCAAWGHVMNLADRDASQFAAATIALQDATDFDFIKVMSNPYYLIEDTGLKLIPPANEACCITRSEDLPIKSAADWARLPFPKVGHGALAREADAIRRIVEHYQGDVPVIATIFTPMMWLSYTALRPSELERCERQYGTCTHAVRDYLLRHEKETRTALEIFSEINLEYMHALLSAGVSGFFYCTEHANTAWESEEEFRHFEGRFDLAALHSVESKSFFNILHVCGSHSLCMDYVLNYPVHAINWEDQSPENPSLHDLRALTDKVLIGGLDRHKALKGELHAVKENLQSSLHAALSGAGNRFILSGGCDWKYEDAARLPLIREAAEKYV